MKFKRGYHYMLLWVSLAVTVACLFMIPHVVVNSDMTKYLPDSSRMKAGLKVMQKEFGRAEMNSAGVRVMVEDLSLERQEEFSGKILSRPEVDEIVACKTSPDGHYTLFELNVPQSVNQKALGKEIAGDFSNNVIVETGQDGNTPPLHVIVIAIVMIVVILVLMSGSWLDPVLILASAGMAIAMNIGTNALLPSVSITTNYIGAILQLVLSLDFSIILLNRYRQEKSSSTSVTDIKGGISPVDAINAAIPKAFPSICSSAFTTVVGLLMLVFMKLKIGTDMGIVLAKGVLCSLICTFTALPSIIILLHSLMEKTNKKGFVIRTDRLAEFCLRHKTPLTAFFIILFAASFYFHDRTEISFSTNGESRIDNVFPKVNTAVLLYSNDDEGKILDLADSLLACDGITKFISYPTMLEKPYTADQMRDAIEALGAEMDSNSPEIIDVGALSPDVLKLVFYMSHASDDEMRLDFPCLAEFITGYCLNSPLLKDRIDDATREKIEVLAEMTGQPVETAPSGPVAEPEPEPRIEPVPDPVPVPEPKPEPKPVEIVPVEKLPVEDSGNISIIEFMPKLYSYRQNYNTQVMMTFVDTVLLHKVMSVKEMSNVIGSTEAQTRMVFSLRKSRDNRMTPLEYTHFLSDDLFNRKVVSSMVKDEEKQGLRARMRVMDLADADAMMSPEDLAALIASFGEVGITEDVVREIAGGTAPVPVFADAGKTVEGVEPGSDDLGEDGKELPIVARTDTAATPKPKPVRRKKTKEEIQAELMAEMLYSGKTYTASQITKNIAVLGESLDPGLMDIVYAYYGSVNNYDDCWTMTISEFMKYLSDDILADERFEDFLDSSTREKIADAREMMNEGIGMLSGENYSIAVMQSSLPDESEETYKTFDRVQEICESQLGPDYYLIGESVMFNEMRHGFRQEMKLVTWLTIAAILLIIVISFRSLISPVILVMTVMTAVFVNVIFSGIFNGSMLYLAYLITQSILMGATIDYGILFTNYYREKRKTMGIDDAIRSAYNGSIHTICTSGLIMILATGMMAFLVNDTTISAIVGSISIGATVAVALILTVLPGLLVAIDKYLKL